MVIFPRSKINLGLRITGKRDDGYHNIETIFYPVGLRDALEFTMHNSMSRKDELTVTGIHAEYIAADNLVTRAVEKLRELYSFPALKIHLHKGIPAGAGLGGGSSDAAGMIRLLNRYFNLSLSQAGMKSVALALGSDCPFFIDNVPSLARGRGEILEPVGSVLENKYIVLLNPGINISTREAYKDCIPEIPESSLSDLVQNPISTWRNLIINDFEKTIFARHPELNLLKETLYDSGALYASMSGSGSSVYGIFPGKPSLPQKLKDYLIYEGCL